MKAQLALITSGAAALALMSPGWSLAKPPIASLVETRLTHVEDITGQPGAPRLCVDDKQTICVDGSYRLSFTVLHTLQGAAVRGPLRMEIGSARPRLGLHDLMVVSHSNGQPKIEWHGSFEDGLCLELNELDRFGLSEALKRYPCRRR